MWIVWKRSRRKIICQIVGNNTIHELLIQTDFLQWSSKKERKVNALAIGADEGRGKLR